MLVLAYPHDEAGGWLLEVCLIVCRSLCLLTRELGKHDRLDRPVLIVTGTYKPKQSIPTPGRKCLRAVIT
eukprot:1195883-Prorocentrum_minimum.AAC.2